MIHCPQNLQGGFFLCRSKVDPTVEQFLEVGGHFCERSLYKELGKRDAECTANRFQCRNGRDRVSLENIRDCGFRKTAAYGKTLGRHTAFPEQLIQAFVCIHTVLLFFCIYCTVFYNSIVWSTCNVLPSTLTFGCDRMIQEVIKNDGCGTVAKRTQMLFQRT